MPVTANENMSRKRSRKRKVGDDDTDNLHSQQHPLAAASIRGLDYNVVRMLQGNNDDFAVEVGGMMDSFSSPAAVVGQSSTSSFSSGAPTFRANQEESTDVTNDPLVKMFQSFRLNQEQRPLKIVRSSYQYLYDTTNSEYLDCVNSVSHVGHCHPAVVKAAAASMERDPSITGMDIDHGEMKYPDKLRQTLPHYLDTFLFCNSGSEAVDLALQLSTLHTGGTDAVVTDNAFHGSIGSVHHLSPKVFKANNMTKADWVHILAMPDLYRGQYQHGDPEAVHKYLSDARQVIESITQSGRKLACFIAEPMLVVPGMVIPSAAWLQEIYKMVREAGGLCIADEVQAGLGRVGSHFWSFQAQGVGPDILIIGKNIGNGYPMALVATSREIAAVLGDRIKEYGCSRMMDAVGCAVLEVLQEEHLMTAAMSVGKYLREQLTILQHKHDYIGDVRGLGLMVGLEVVWSKESKRPAREVAEHIIYKMKEENVILACEGYNRNILMMMPPMCFTRDNVVHLVQQLDKVLSELPRHCYPVEGSAPVFCPPVVHQSTVSEGRLGILQPQEEEDEEDQLASRENLEGPKHNYQDLD
ncbi:hypothetical protein Pcinc_018475 [Petrolisthes cinctipes]|uniref:Alanine-glyoxylate aminotransferase n=1 Tax=Petrolisthes cinctipes TaxID=88211 RepID=A0AAE1FM33_PETCI|nr:hypothetical protein Pcinc_018475 [Petrolisthes cinctipes]